MHRLHAAQQQQPQPPDLHTDHLSPDPQQLHRLMEEAQQVLEQQQLQEQQRAALRQQRRSADKERRSAERARLLQEMEAQPPLSPEQLQEQRTSFEQARRSREQQRRSHELQQLHLLQYQQQEDPLVDPLTKEHMRDPVKCSDDRTYNRWSAIAYRDSNGGLSPVEHTPGFDIVCDDVERRKLLFQVVHGAEDACDQARAEHRARALKAAEAVSDVDQCAAAQRMLDDVLQWAPSDGECSVALWQLQERMPALAASAKKGKKRAGSAKLLSPGAQRVAVNVLATAAAGVTTALEWWVPLLAHKGADADAKVEVGGSEGSESKVDKDHTRAVVEKLVSLLGASTFSRASSSGSNGSGPHITGVLTHAELAAAVAAAKVAEREAAPEAPLSPISPVSPASSHPSSKAAATQPAELPALQSSAGSAAPTQQPAAAAAASTDTAAPADAVTEAEAAARAKAARAEARARAKAEAKARAKALAAAAQELMDLAAGSDQQKVHLAATPGAVPALVALLDPGRTNHTTAEAAAVALTDLGGSSASRAAQVRHEPLPLTLQQVSAATGHFGWVAEHVTLQGSALAS